MGGVVARFIYEHRAAFVAGAGYVFTAFLNTSPEPGEPFGWVCLYSWTRRACFLMLNAHHLPPQTFTVATSDPNAKQ